MLNNFDSTEMHIQFRIIYLKQKCLNLFNSIDQPTLHIDYLYFFNRNLHIHFYLYIIYDIFSVRYFSRFKCMYLKSTRYNIDSIEKNNHYTRRILSSHKLYKYKCHRAFVRLKTVFSPFRWIISIQTYITIGQFSIHIYLELDFINFTSSWWKRIMMIFFFLLWV